MPKFSIIIPLYNKETHILKTLECIFKQSYTDYEIIIVNDGSTDNSYSIVSKIKHPKVKLYNRENHGVSDTRNFAMQRAKGEYLAFLDADDIWKSNHLKTLDNLIIKYPNCGLYATNYMFDYGNFKVKTKFPTLPNNDDWDGIIVDYFSASMLFRIAWTSSVVIPKKTFINLGGFNSLINHGEDVEYWSKIALNYQIAFSKKITSFYILNCRSRLSNINLNKRKMMNFEKFKIFEKNNYTLKKFNDIYRYKFALDLKINNDINASNEYLKEIDWNNLSFKKKILIKLPFSILSRLWAIKQWLKTKQVLFYI